MSTLVYGWDSAGREATTVAQPRLAASEATGLAGSPPAPAAPGADEPGKKGFSAYVDIVSAIVPAEVLALNALLIQLMTETNDEGGESVTAITEPGTLQVVFWLSIATAIGLYLIADRTGARKKAAEESEKLGPRKEVKPVPISFGTVMRALIPAAAYVAWTMLQKSTAFDAIAPGMDEALRMTIAAFGAVLLGALAKLLLDKADEKAPPEPVSAA